MIPISPTQLMKLHNQIRVQKNKTRYSRQMALNLTPTKQSKRMIPALSHNKSAIFNLDWQQQLRRQSKLTSKRHFNYQESLLLNENETANGKVERRHFQEGYKIKLDIKMEIISQKSPYTNKGSKGISRSPLKQKKNNIFPSQDNELVSNRQQPKGQAKLYINNKRYKRYDCC